MQYLRINVTTTLSSSLSSSTIGNKNKPLKKKMQSCKLYVCNENYQQYNEIHNIINDVWLRAPRKTDLPHDSIKLHLLSWCISVRKNTNTTVKTIIILQNLNLAQHSHWKAAFFLYVLSSFAFDEVLRAVAAKLLLFFVHTITLIHTTARYSTFFLISLYMYVLTI